MRELAGRAWFHVCLALGRLLRAARYSRTRVVSRGGEREVRKRRVSWAPLVVWLGGPLARILDAGVRVLPQRQWQERERRLYEQLRGSSIRVERDGMLILPCIAGETLASLLEKRSLDPGVANRGIDLAVVALAALHRAGFTHGDAMAENVMVDLESGIAHWFDFETIHDPARPVAWCRADDVRALLATCLLRVELEELGDVLQLILDVYADEEVTRLTAASFTSVFRRPLVLHLGQAPLSYGRFRTIDRLLGGRLRSASDPRSR